MPHFALHIGECRDTRVYVFVELVCVCVCVCVRERQLWMNGEGPECQCVVDRSGHSEHTKYMSLVDVAQGLGDTHTLPKAGA